MDRIDRRHFLGATAGVAACFGATNRLLAKEPAAQAVATDPTSAATNERPPVPPTIELGKTGIKMSRLGQGTGVKGFNRQSDQTHLGFEKLVALMHHAYDRGITFFDLADLYGTHVYFREALRTMPREKLTILTKMWWRYDGPEDQANSPERRQIARTALERFRHEIATDYLDIVLLHCMTAPDWDKQMQPYMEVLDEEKQKGLVKAVGCSCHDLQALRTAAVSPWVDVIFARVNLQGTEAKMDASPEEVVPVLRTAKENGKAVIGIKIFGEGRLVDQREACMKYVQELGVLDAMSIGFHTPEQIDDVLRLMHKHPAKAMA